MRSVSLFAVAVLGVLLMAAFASVATAQPLGVFLVKETTNGDQTTLFVFTVTRPVPSTATAAFSIVGGVEVNLGDNLGTYSIVETVPPGWVLRDISCSVTVVAETDAVGSIGVMSYAPQTDGSSWTVDLPNHSVTIVLGADDSVVCTFTNSPEEAVGGVVTPADTFATVAPWLAVIGVVGCIGTVAVVAKKRRP